MNDLTKADGTKKTCTTNGMKKSKPKINRKARARGERILKLHAMGIGFPEIAEQLGVCPQRAAGLCGAALRRYLKDPRRAQRMLERDLKALKERIDGLIGEAKWVEFRTDLELEKTIKREGGAYREIANKKLAYQTMRLLQLAHGALAAMEVDDLPF